MFFPATQFPSVEKLSVVTEVIRSGVNECRLVNFLRHPSLSDLDWRSAVCALLEYFIPVHLTLDRTQASTGKLWTKGQGSVSYQSFWSHGLRTYRRLDTTASAPQGSLKTGQSGSLQNRTTVKARDIDVDRGPYRLCRHEQCLERGKETTSHRTGKARMVFTKDRARNRCST